MQFINLPLEDAYSIEFDLYKDNRGSFSRIFCSKELKEIMKSDNVEQVNISNNYKKGLIRGLHYQKEPMSEKKIIKCIKGKVYDVIVDLRTNSSTFLKWYGFELNENENKALIIPNGCAHGFQVLEDNSQLLYFHTNFYSPDHDAGVHYKDPKIKIDWPLSVSEISKKDQEFKFLNENFKGV